MYELQLTADARADLQRLDATIRRLALDKCICPQFCESFLFCKVCVVCTRKSVCLWYTPEIDEIYIFL